MKKKTMAALAVLLTVLLACVPLLTNRAEAVESEKSVVIGPVLQEKLQSATGQLEVVVTFDGEGAPTAEDIHLLKSVGITTGLTMRSLPIAGVLATPEQIRALAGDSDVRSIYFNRKLEYYNEKATELTGVDKVREDDEMQMKNGGLPITGEAGAVLINDSGVDGTHPDIEYGNHLVENVLATTNLNAYSNELLPITYVEGVVNTDTNSGHGTHVAGIVGATGEMSGGKYEGVAPGADLVGYGSGAALFILDAVGGFDYAITHQAQYDIRVITNSWGTTGEFQPDDPVNVASKAAYDRGIAVTFAAGNAGPDADTMNPYSLAPWVISVAAGNFERQLADFSSRGVKGECATFEMEGETYTYCNRPDITAPGVQIISTRTLSPLGVIGTTTDAETIPPAYLPYYTTMSGTSMATPHVAGVIMLMLDANPELTVGQIYDILKDTATEMPGYEPWEVGAGYVNAYDAVKKSFDSVIGVEKFKKHGPKKK